MELFHYAIRLTPYPNTEQKVQQVRDLIPSFIQLIGGIDYLYGQEYEKNHHFHIVFSISHQIQDEILDNFKETLYSTFEVPKNKIGNPTYSMDEVRDLSKALSYAVKDGNYQCSEDWETITLEAFQSSHPKKHSLKRSLVDLTELYMQDKISDRDLWIGLGQSRSDLGLPLSLRWVDEMLLSIQCKKDPSKLRNIWEERIIKEQLKSM